MIAEDENALICDLAETYGIYDYRQLPASRVAVFALGLNDNSRIKMKLSRQKVPQETLLLAGILDRLSLLVWWKTEDGQKGVNKPVMFTEILEGTKEKTEGAIVFNSGEDFEKARARIMRGRVDGN